MTAYNLDSYLDAAAAVIGLGIGPDYRAEVLANLERTSKMAALILDFDLPEEYVDAAPVFCPGEVE